MEERNVNFPTKTELACKWSAKANHLIWRLGCAAQFPLPSPPNWGKLFSFPGLLRPHSFKPDWFWQLRCQRIWSIDRGGHFCSIWKIVGNYPSVKKLLVQSTTESLIIDTHWGRYPFSVVSSIVLCSNICPALKSVSSNGTWKQNVYTLQTSLNNTWPLNSGTNDSLRVLRRKSLVSLLYITAMICLFRSIYTSRVLFSWKKFV